MQASGACLGTHKVPCLYGGLLLLKLCGQLGLGTGGHLDFEAHLCPPDGEALLEVRECLQNRSSSSFVRVTTALGGPVKLLEALKSGNKACTQKQRFKQWS